MRNAFDGRDVLITGAGGFIGSALVEVLHQSSVRSLSLLDASERNLFDLQRRLNCAKCRFILGNVADSALTSELLAQLDHPLVIHAAAYKHVALLETALIAAVVNNTLATYTLAKTALDHGASGFLFISTDKAVNPHSVMGASKRAAELLALSLTSLGLRVNALRLGNVLGSTGSVVPLFQEQNEKEHKLTVSDPNACRYFFSSEQATELICRAAAAQVSGRVLLPRFHSPTKVVDLARSLFPDTDLEFGGLRPGEKLTEEFIAADERCTDEISKDLRALETRSVSAAECARIAGELRQWAELRDSRTLMDTLCRFIPEYRPSELARRHAGLA